MMLSFLLGAALYGIVSAFVSLRMELGFAEHGLVSIVVTLLMLVLLIFGA